MFEYLYKVDKNIQINTICKQTKNYSYTEEMANAALRRDKTSYLESTSTYLNLIIQILKVKTNMNK